MRVVKYIFFEPHRIRIVEVMAKLRFSVRVATAYPTDKNWGARGPHNVRRDISKVTEPIIFKLKYVLDGHLRKGLLGNCQHCSTSTMLFDRFFKKVPNFFFSKKNFKKKKKNFKKKKNKKLSNLNNH